jgi:uncharacterized protein YutE (UPF0331/DUF86 family)
LALAGLLDRELGARLMRGAGFRNAVVHVYEKLSLSITFESAKSGPADLRAFLAAMRKLT